MAQARPRLSVLPGEAIRPSTPAPAGRDERTRPDLVVVPRPRRRWAGLVAASAVVTVFVLLFGLAVFQTALVQGQQRLDALRREVAAEQAYYARLRLEVARQEAPANVVAAAQLRLGMTAAAEPTYLTPSAAHVAEAIAAVANPLDPAVTAFISGPQARPADATAGRASSWPELKSALDGAP